MGHYLSTVDQQKEFLLKVGTLLDCDVTPGGESDWFGDEPLIDKTILDRAAKTGRRWPAKYIDVLMERLICVKDGITQQPVPLVPNLPQRDFSKHRAGYDIILKSGKVGFTTYVGLIFLIKIITHLGKNALLVAHEQDITEDLFMQISYALANIPGEMGKKLREGALKTGKASVRELFFPALNSRYFVETAGDSMAAVGQNIQYLHCSEVSRWRKANPKQVITNLMSHLIGDNTEACFESRPFGDFGEFYDRYWKAKRGEGKFSAHFYQWWWAPHHRAPLPKDFLLSEEEQAICARYKKWRAQEALRGCGLALELLPEQVYWRRLQRGELVDLAAQEFAEDEITCFISSGNSPFSSTGIQRIAGCGAQPMQIFKSAGEDENGLWIYEMPVEGEDYIIFLDTAGGMASDRSALQVINRRTRKQVAEYVGREDFASQAAMSARLGLMYNTALVAFENNMGNAAATIMMTLHSYPFLYHHTEPDQVGWPTNRNREDMLDRLNRVVMNEPELFVSPRLAQELKTCERKGNKIMAKPGHTDDLVLAMAGALAVQERVGPYADAPICEVIMAKPQISLKAGLR